MTAAAPGRSDASQAFILNFPFGFKKIFSVLVQKTWTSSNRMRVSCVSMGPPPPPRAQPPKAVTDSSFLEKLHAVEEELAVCMKPYQVTLHQRAADVDTEKNILMLGVQKL